MKFARIGPLGSESPAALGTDGQWHDLRALIADIDAAALATGLPRREVDALPVLPAERFGAPLAGIGKLVCVGLNYTDHARELKTPPPAEPIVFIKTASTVIGPDDDVLIPRTSVKTDWEAELGVVIGRAARYLDRPDGALDHVAGYVVSNDVSEREFQFERGGQWDKGKNCETFNPLGPWLVTADEIPDPQQLGLRLWVNGVPRQKGNTADMIFDVAHLIWYLSQFMVLYPGDVINTGTPAGVAMGSADVPYLLAGDVVEIEIDGLGRQRQLLASA